MVEVTFTVSPRLRRIAAHSPDTLSEVEYYRQIFWCSGVDLPETLEDSLAEFTIDSIELTPGGKAVLSVQLPNDFVIVFDPVTHGTQFIDVKGEPTRERQTLTMVFNNVKAPVGTIEMRPGPLRLALENRTDRRVLPALWIAADPLHHLLGKRRPFLTAKRLLSNQTFRDIYRTDTLDVDQRLKITSLTFLFTDLKGSTALYERVGDLMAYDLVRQHFHILYEVVAAEAGAVVKTIGDAVMATFTTPDRALAAALRMREEMTRINAERQNEDLLLKIGIHEGPCLAVTLNNSQDYFGQTVNMAARVQGLASSRAIFVTKSVVDDEKAAQILKSSGLQPTMQRAALRGITDETTFDGPPRRPADRRPTRPARSGKDLSGFVGPIPSGLACARLAIERRRPVRGHRLHYPRRSGPGGDCRARTWHQADRDGLRVELYRHQSGRFDGA
jgi:class 3 adenylate cyclase